MKKLLLAAILLSVLSLQAQNDQTLGIIVGPASLYQFSGVLVDGPSFESLGGWQAGLDYNVTSSERWEMKAGIRYHASKSLYEQNYLYYASEYATGVYVYDPTLVHSIRIEYRNRAWQLLLGARLYAAAPATWRFYLNGEFGLTQYEQRQTASPTLLYQTFGLGVGLQWMRPEKRFGVFLQPMARLSTGFRRNNESDAFAILAMEMGLRAQLFSGD